MLLQQPHEIRMMFVLDLFIRNLFCFYTYIYTIEKNIFSILHIENMAQIMHMFILFLFFLMKLACK